VLLARVLATWFGSGHAPIAPGTAGTLATVPVYLLLWRMGAPAWAVPLAAIVVGAVGVASAGRYERGCGRHDPQEVVIDEAAGYLVACCFGPLGWRTAVLAFVLFRLIDACKPGPVQSLERLPGGWGVMADDLGAGVAAGLVTWLAWGLLASRWLGCFGPAA
jgi:phosphatidylglycerophosphatase A